MVSMLSGPVTFGLPCLIRSGPESTAPGATLSPNDVVEDCKVRMTSSVGQLFNYVFRIRYSIVVEPLFRELQRSATHLLFCPLFYKKLPKSAKLVR